MTMLCERVRRARPLLGTVVEISLAGRNETELHDAAAAAFAGIAHIHQLMSLQSAQSELFRLNNAPVGTTVRVSPQTWEVLALAGDVAWLSGGAFDITVGAAMMARGGVFLPCQKQPDALATYRDVELLDGFGVRFRRSLAIDVGGIAKGYAVDHAVRILRDLEVPAGCVNAGGDLRAFGDESVVVQIRDPGDPGRARARVDLRNRALATSANYSNDSAFNAAGVVLDPRAGNTTSVQGRSASVRAQSCAVADALAKCVLLSGADSIPALRHYQADGFVLDENGAFAIDTSVPDTGLRPDVQNDSVANPAHSIPRQQQLNGQQTGVRHCDGLKRGGSKCGGFDQTGFNGTGVVA